MEHAIIVTAARADKLRRKSERLAAEAEKLLRRATRTDNPEHWDAWKEAGGYADGFAAAVEEILGDFGQ